MNYAELRAAIHAYAENDEQLFNDNIPAFVQQAEKRIYNSVQLPALRKNVAGTTTSNNRYLSTPTDFLAPFSLALTDVSGNSNYLIFKDVNFMREAFPNPADTGIPLYYAIFDNNTFILGPTPSATQQAELHYYYYPESIVTAGTSWLGDNFDTVLLYGSLVEAYTFMKGEQDIMNLYIGKYAEALDQLKRLGDGLDRRDSYRNGQLRVEPK